MTNVLQDWVGEIPWKCQSILLSGLRGPDHAHCPNVKAVTRWLRRVSQHNADPSGDYMQTTPLPAFVDVEKELEFLPCHFVHHLADAQRVVAIFHPLETVTTYAYGLHVWIALEMFHFMPESNETFLARRRDRVSSTEGE